MSDPLDPRMVVRRHVEISCEVVRERGFRLLGSRTLDVSTEGLRFAWNGEAILTGEPVIASFRVPGTWIDVEATVARVCHGRRSWDTASVGVTFDVIAPSSRAALAAYLLGLPRAGGQRRELSVRRARVEQLAHQSAVKEILAGLSSLGDMFAAV